MGWDDTSRVVDSPQYIDAYDLLASVAQREVVLPAKEVKMLFGAFNVGFAVQIPQVSAPAVRSLKS